MERFGSEPACVSMKAHSIGLSSTGCWRRAHASLTLISRHSWPCSMERCPRVNRAIGAITASSAIGASSKHSMMMQTENPLSPTIGPRAGVYGRSLSGSAPFSYQPPEMPIALRVGQKKLDPSTGQAEPLFGDTLSPAPRTEFQVVLAGSRAAVFRVPCIVRRSRERCWH